MLHRYLNARRCTQMYLWYFHEFKSVSFNFFLITLCIHIKHTTYSEVHLFVHLINEYAYLLILRLLAARYCMSEEISEINFLLQDCLRMINASFYYQKSALKVIDFTVSCWLQSDSSLCRLFSVE